MAASTALSLMGLPCRPSPFALAATRMSAPCSYVTPLHATNTSFVPSSLSSALSAYWGPATAPSPTLCPRLHPSPCLRCNDRNLISGTRNLRSWFGPNGQYIRELPCPSCRGRGYTPCRECGIERSRVDCSECNGKGLKTCQQCSGDRVIWEESIDEGPWEKVRSSSPLKVKEDDEVDKLEIKLDLKQRSKRVYQSRSPEVGMKISQSLKILNAKTGLFSNRMKILHRDPELHAQRVAAIKKAKGTEEARKKASEVMKAYFSDPDNRLKRSSAMKGVKFHCSHCRKEGHRRHYCPLLIVDPNHRKSRCRLCGESGHNRRTCGKQRKEEILHPRGGKPCSNRCRICGLVGHNRRKCPQLVNKSDGNNDLQDHSKHGRSYT